MSSKLDKLYSLFIIRPKEMTAWGKEDWTEEQSGKVRREYYIPKREIFCHALNRDGSLCKSAEEAERARKEFEKQVLEVLRADNINENGTLEELTDTIQKYKLRENKLGSKKSTQVEQSDDTSEANALHDSALSSIKRPRDDGSSTESAQKSQVDYPAFEHGCSTSVPSYPCCGSWLQSVFNTRNMVEL
ncbi:hypothetical protein ACHAPF_006736 [Botrytis cinerea]